MGTRAGTVELQIPKLRKGSHFPVFVEHRRTAENALIAVIQEAYAQGLLIEADAQNLRKLAKLIRSEEAVTMTPIKALGPQSRFEFCITLAMTGSTTLAMNEATRKVSNAVTIPA